MMSSVRLFSCVVLSCALLLLLLSSSSASSLAALRGENNSSSTGVPNTPYGCDVSAPEPPFVLVSNFSLHTSTESIAIYDSTLYYAEPYSVATGFVYAIDLTAQTALPPIDVRRGNLSFPGLPYAASGWQLRVDNTGRLHLVDFQNGAIICLTTDGVWQSVVAAGAGGVWSVDISPDGETHYVNGLGGNIQAIQRSTGASLPFKHASTSSSIAYGPDGSMYLANNQGPSTTIDTIDSEGKVLSTMDLSAYDSLKLHVTAMVVDADSTIIFTNAQGSSCNDLCFYFPGSGSLYCWEDAAGYDFGLAYDAVSGQVSSIRGWDDGAVFTFMAPVESMAQAKTRTAQEHVLEA